MNDQPEESLPKTTPSAIEAPVDTDPHTSILSIVPDKKELSKVCVCVCVYFISTVYMWCIAR
jgi:hypothetical protein